MALLIFVYSLGIALLLLSIALVIWLTEIVGSITIALSIVGCVLLIISSVVYLVWLRSAIFRLRHRIDTIYSVSALLSNLYRHVVTFIRNL